MNAFGLEEGDDRVNGFKSNTMKRRVLRKSFARINTHDFKTENFLFGLRRESGMKWRVERMFMEKGFGFG